jgi:hypothetical protein
MMTSFALTFQDGSFIFLGILVVSIVVLGFSLYSRRGSGISQQPYGDIDHSSGPESPSGFTDVTEDVRDWDRGTAGHHGHSRRPPPERE